MARGFIKDLSDGTRQGNTRGLLKCRANGWQIINHQRHGVWHAPRVPNDPSPWTDGVTRYRALDCWAVPLHRPGTRPAR